MSRARKSLPGVDYIPLTLRAPLTLIQLHLLSNLLSFSTMDPNHSPVHPSSMANAEAEVGHQPKKGGDRGAGDINLRDKSKSHPCDGLVQQEYEDG